MKLMRKVVDTLKDVANAESNPKMEGKQAFLILAPDPVKVKEYIKLHPKSTEGKAPESEPVEDHEEEAEAEE